MVRFEEGGWWLPDGEQHLQEWMNKVGVRIYDRLGYQYHKYQLAMKFVQPDRRRIAIDVGAHVGLWTWPMMHDFQSVRAFEPMSEHRECFKANIPMNQNVILYEVALGETIEEVKLRTRTPGSSGDTGVDPAAERSSLRGAVDDEGETCLMTTLDSFDFEQVDFVKVDTEGYELFVLRGGERMLRECKPVCIVEQKPETGGASRYGIGVTDAVTYLESLGAKRRGGIQGDYVLSWD